MNSKLVALLRDARISAGLTQKDVANLLGIKDNTLSNWETGRTEPDMDSFLSLCDIYSVDAAHALTSTYGEGQDKPAPIHFSRNEHAIISAYRIASDDDRAIVDTALRKYMATDALKRDMEKMA